MTTTNKQVQSKTLKASRKRSNRQRMTAARKRELMRKFHIMFDYDNTLGLTEAPAFKACCMVINATLVSKNVATIKLFTPESLMKRFVGYSFRRMITELAAEHGFSFDEGMSEELAGEIFRPELEILVKKEEMAVIAQLATDIKPCPGANEALARLADIEKSVVSSSAERRVRACLNGAGQEGFFQQDRIFSAANYKSSKPDPLVYLEALKALDLKAHFALAIEDSTTGARAAIGAGITVIGYLGAYPVEEHAHIRAELKKLGVKHVMVTYGQIERIVGKIAVERFGHLVD
jgi:HAD superfamily hydrolase (TIGR01509 family)